jgi:hypothetical protein
MPIEPVFCSPSSKYLVMLTVERTRVEGSTHSACTEVEIAPSQRATKARRTVNSPE